MTVKEQIVEFVCQAGFDFISACELADNCINEFKTSGDTKRTYILGTGISITLTKR